MNCEKFAKKSNWILLGLLMLIPGLLKLFVMGPSAITGMLEGFGFRAAGLFAWLLIIGEIGSGAAILAKWKLKYAVWPPVVILVVAALLTGINWSSFGESQFPSFLLHLLAATNYMLLGSMTSK